MILLNKNTRGQIGRLRKIEIQQKKKLNPINDTNPINNTSPKLDKKRIGFAMLTLNQMVDGVLLEGNLSVSETGNITEDKPPETPKNPETKDKVKIHWNKKAFDLGSEKILRHHSSGLIGEFPHKILY